MIDMREITFFWRRNRLAETDIAPMLDIVQSAEFLSYLKRTPRDVHILMKTVFQPGKKPEDLNELYFLNLIEIHQVPELENGVYLLNVKLSHPLANFNARTGGTSTMPSSKLSGDGLTYILQGSNLRLRLVAAMARLISKPDRISARRVNVAKSDENGPLSNKQLKLAKFAYDCGWYNPKKQVTLSDMAEELGMARATMSEHLSRIECILMDDFLGSFSNVKFSNEEIATITGMVESDAEELGVSDDGNFKVLLNNIRSSYTKNENGGKLVE